MPTSFIQSLNFQITLNIFSSAASHVLVDFFINRSVHYLPSIFFLESFMHYEALSNPTRQQLYCRYIGANVYHSSTVSLHSDSAISPLLPLYVKFKQIYILLCVYSWPCVIQSGPWWGLPRFMVVQINSSEYTLDAAA